MFKKIFKFITGYVIIKVMGKNRERFVSMCLYNDYDIDNVIPTEDGLLIRISLRDFFEIRRLVRKCGVKVRVVSKQGLRLCVRQYRHRYGFLAAGLAACIFFTIIPKYIWCVEIDGAYEADKARIMDILREHGVYPGARKSRIDDLGEIKNSIVYGVDGVNWAWLYTDGSRARLQIQETVKAPPIADRVTPTDIIAACDGWIVRADVLHGERRVNTGMTVNAGDTLVSGKVAVFREGFPEEYIYMRSQADIVADTIRHETGVFSKKETLRIKTGRMSRRFSVELFGMTLNFYRNSDCGYEEFDTVEERYELSIPFYGFSGVAVTMKKVYEVNELERELSEQEVIERARERLEEKICRALTVGAVRTEERLTYSADSSGYRVELLMRLKENIGIEVPTEE